MKDTGGNYKPPSFTMISKKLVKGKDKAFESQALASSFKTIELLAKYCEIQVVHSVEKYKEKMYKQAHHD